MFKKLALSAVAALGLASGSAFAAGEGGHVEDFAFSFEGPFGAYDQAQLQRGLQIFTEVCAACHGLKFVPLRTLSDEDLIDPSSFPNMPPDWQPWMIIAQNTYEHYRDHILDVERWLAAGDSSLRSE